MSDEVPESAQKPQLQESFNLLKSHACKVANFTLLWQELEDHFRFINSQIESRLHQLQHPTTTNPIEDDDNTDNKKNPENRQNPPTQLPVLFQNDNYPDVEVEDNDNNPDVEIEDRDKSESETRRESTIPMKNGKELALLVKERVKSGKSCGDEFCGLFKEVDDAGEMVLEALKEFYMELYKAGGGGGGGGAADFETRKCCVVLLEEFVSVREGRVEGKVREEAMRLAVVLREEMNVENSCEVLGFLLLLVGFGLGGEFDCDDILKLFYRVLLRRREPEQGPEWLRALGLADKASEVIQKLIKENKRLEAVRYIFAFELVNEFPPVKLLKAEKESTKNYVKLLRRERPNSLKALNDARDTEIRTLKRIIQVVEKYQLGSQYPSHTLKHRIQQLKMQEKEGNSAAKLKTAGSNTQSQQQNGNKRTAPASSTRRNKKKRRRAAAPNASAGTAPIIDSKLPSHHQRESANCELYTTPSASTGAPSEAAPYGNVVGTSNTHSMQPSSSQPVDFLAGSQQVASSSENNHLSGSYPFTAQLSSAAYSSMSLTSMLRAMYGLSNDSDRSSGQGGLPATPTANSIVPNASTAASVPYNQSNQPRTSLDYGMQASSRTAGINPTPNTHGYYEWPQTSSLPGPYGTSIAANRSSAQFGLAGITPNTTPNTLGYYQGPQTSSLPGPYGTSDTAYRSSAQFGLAGNSTPMGNADGPSINTSVPFNLRDLLRSSQSYYI